MTDPSPARPRGPFAASEGRCGAASDDRDGVSGFSLCQRPVVYAGTASFPYPQPRTWLAFACEAHRSYLDDPHPLTDAERAELEHREEQRRRGRAGLSFERPRPLRGRPRRPH